MIFTGIGVSGLSYHPDRTDQVPKASDDSGTHPSLYTKKENFETITASLHLRSNVPILLGDASNFKGVALKMNIIK